MKKNLAFILILVSPLFLRAQSSEDCLDCHDDSDLYQEIEGRQRSLYVAADEFLNSVHSDLDCIDCHEDFDPEELPHRDGENISQVDCSSCHDTDAFESSIHAEKNVKCSQCHSEHNIQPADSIAGEEAKFCVKCHTSANVKGYLKSIHYEKKLEGETSPECLDCHNKSAHEIKAAVVSENALHQLCAECHVQKVEEYEKSLHGIALSNGRTLAPNCLTCHNSHKIQSHKNPDSKTYVTNIPFLCGDCHKDGTKVSELKVISQRHILENYKESIHGDGLLKRGLIVTAVCTSCHFAHNILSHTDPRSSINKSNIAATCMQCHSQIEKVHTKVINGKLWETEPHKIPACIECHQPHSIRRVYYDDNFSDKMCLSCHSNRNLFKTENGEKISLFIDEEHLAESAHEENSCIKCHTNISISNNPVCLNSGKVDCSICHAESVEQYNLGTHGKLHAIGDEETPYCTDCHGTHNVLKKDDKNSPTFAQNIPKLCGSCHRSGVPVKRHPTAGMMTIVADYTTSTHGKGLLKSGLVVTATCINCHTAHMELPPEDPQSSINKENVPATCGSCHFGIYQIFEKSIHSPYVSNSSEKLPSCTDCHLSHSIERTSLDDFRNKIIIQCGNCHKEVTEKYFETLHGKVSRLGMTRAAKCYDCHGSHNILPVYFQNSTLNRNNIIETCRKCHSNSNRKFVGYLTHATHHDREKYPYLFYTFWAMTILLIGTFSFFGFHTLLWLIRGLIEKRKIRRVTQNNNSENE